MDPMILQSLPKSPLSIVIPTTEDVFDWLFEEAFAVAGPESVVNWIRSEPFQRPPLNVDQYAPHPHKLIRIRTHFEEKNVLTRALEVINSDECMEDCPFFIIECPLTSLHSVQAICACLAMLKYWIDNGNEDRRAVVILPDEIRLKTKWLLSMSLYTTEVYGRDDQGVFTRIAMESNEDTGESEEIKEEPVSQENSDDASLE